MTVAEGVITPDPFRDVIRTEAAPDLHSLIVDMMPFLTKTTPVSPNTTETPENLTNNTSQEDSFSFDKVLQLLFANERETTAQETTTSVKIQTQQQQETAGFTTSQTSGSEKLKMATTEISKLETRENVNSNDRNHPNSVDSGGNPGGLAILKLAGCNIYGRMYRVGRIISELSNACLECKCTEIGVQCRALEC